MNYIFTVYDEDHKIADKEFTNFSDAWDYAQEGAMPYIWVTYPDTAEEECIWGWDDYMNDKDEVINELTYDHPEFFNECMTEDITDTDDDESVTCSWCGEAFPVSDCRKEVDLGYLCPQCQAAIKSHGESLTFVENENLVTEDAEVMPIDEDISVEVSADNPAELAAFTRAMFGDADAAFTMDFDMPTAEVDPDIAVEDPEFKDYEDVDSSEEISSGEKPVEPSSEEEVDDVDDEAKEEIPEEEKEMMAEIEKVPADKQPMDMINGKLVPAKDPKASEVEIEDEEVDDEDESIDESLTEGEEDSNDKYYYIGYTDKRGFQAAFITLADNEEDAKENLYNYYFVTPEDFEIETIDEISESEAEGYKADVRSGEIPSDFIAFDM